MANGAEFVRVVHGVCDPLKRTLYVPVRNEMAFLPAFFRITEASGSNSF